jgi:ribosomal protein L11 methyltransferase
VSGSHGSTFVLKALLPRQVRCEGRIVDREEFFDFLWAVFGQEDGGLLGVHEGTLLCEQAVELGLETESWTVDSGEAPRERDWMGHQSESEVELYFATDALARAALERLSSDTPAVRFEGPFEQKNQDWDAEWKASWKGVDLGEHWSVVPPWDEFKSQGEHISLKLNPGAGFGTGTHETTQLCLHLLSEAARTLNPAARPEERLKGVRVLDFGSGSGILAIGAARMGAEVDAVEIDPLAIDNAHENAALNGVDSRIRYHLSLETLEPRSQYGIVLANILRPVLVEFSARLAARMESSATLILSGLIEPDVSIIDSVYSRALGLPPTEVRSLNEWRAMRWRR